MTLPARLPGAAVEINTAKRRLAAVERRLKSADTYTGYVASWSLPGSIFASTSQKDGHPSGGRLQLVWAKLTTAGSTATVLSFRKNGVEFAALTLPSGVVYNESPVAALFGPRIDDITVTVTTAGAGAAGLSAFAQFDQ